MSDVGKPQEQPEHQPEVRPATRRTATRRAFIASGAAAAIGAAVARPRPSDDQARLVDEATAVSAAGASLNDIQHVVILMQENRSFDHYFGTLSSVRGFSDPNVPTQTVGGKSYPVFDQFGYQPGTGVDATGYLQPFRLKKRPAAGERGDHQRHRAQLGHPAQELEQRCDGLLRRPRT